MPCLRKRLLHFRAPKIEIIRIPETTFIDTHIPCECGEGYLKLFRKIGILTNQMCHFNPRIVFSRVNNSREILVHC